MEIDSWIALIVAVLCLGLIGVNSAVETALTNISALRLRQLLERGVPRAQAISDLLQSPRRFPSSILFINTISLLTIGSLALYASYYFVTWWSHVLAVIIAALVVLIFGVAVPKAIAMRNPEKAAITLFGPINLLRRVVLPLVVLADAVALPFVRMLGGRASHVGPFVTEEELRMMMNVGEEEGVIQQEEEELIHSIFEFGDTVVREVMVPRPYIVAVEDDCSVADAADIALQSGHTRIPVYHDSIDNVVGVATVQDMMRALRMNRSDHPVTQVMRPVHYVPETKKVDELLRELQKGRMHLTIVIDEYGGTAGLVTIEDLLEEIVGEIRDEYDVELPMVDVINNHEMHVDARVSMDDIKDMLRVDWEAEDSDTIGGYVYEQLGRIPNPGDIVQAGAYTIAVLTTEGTRIKQLSIIHHEAEQAENTPEAGEVEEEGSKT